MVTHANIVTLRTRVVALALFTAGQLFQSAVQFFDLLAHIVRVLSVLRGQQLIAAIRNHPVNAAVYGDQLRFA